MDSDFMKDIPSSDEEDVVDDRKHGQLLDAITSLDGKRRAKLSQRTVIANQISEFNFTASKDASSKIKLRDLIGSLKETTSHGELKKQLRSIESREDTVSVPLPKHEKEKISRSSAYEAVSEDISKWDPIVNQNKKAEQLEFPLQKQEFQVVTTDQFVKRFEPRTPLEQEVAALLRGSDNIIHGENQELTPAEQRALKAMDLQEAKMRRLELMKHRALMSYKEEKAKRQKKIKSKKYHRILKKDKMKAEEKKMDKMKNEDPEGFMEKLNQMEKDRVKERMSLKHRGGSKFAKRQTLYAKYDDRARQEVQDMLQKSRELTKKIQIESDSDTEAFPDIGVDDNVEIPQFKLPKTSNNPWMAKLSAQVASMKHTGEDYSVEDNGVSEYSRPKEIVNEDVANNSNRGDEDSKSVDKTVVTESFIKLSGNDDFNKSVQNKSKTDVIVHDLTSVLDQQAEDDNESSGDDVTGNDVIDDIFETSNQKKLKKAERKKTKIRHRVLRRQMKEIEKKRKVTEASDNVEEGNDVETKYVSVNETVKVKDTVVEDDDIDDNDDDLVNVESLKRKQTLEDIENVCNDSDTHIPVPLKKQKLNENGKNAKTDSEKKNLSKNSKEAFVDPKKLFTLETKLKSVGSGPTIIDNDDDDEDDGVDADEEQRMTIAQAFASDDVIEEFTKEKDEILEQSKPKDIDLTIPGWGSWGGEGITISKKKRKRFTIKAPPALPRKDSQLGHVILNETKMNTVKLHQVSTVPVKYMSTEQFESSIQAPLGKDWNPQTVHKNLIKPKVVTKLGKIIAPIDKTAAFEDYKKKNPDYEKQQKDKKSEKKSNNSKKGKQSDRNKSKTIKGKNVGAVSKSNNNKGKKVGAVSKANTDKGKKVGALAKANTNKGNKAGAVSKNKNKMKKVGKKM
ncbi:U3 small nucleolar RNA-associated protein 14 A [Mactra antiquata]